VAKHSQLGDRLNSFAHPNRRSALSLAVAAALALPAMAYAQAQPAADAPLEEIVVTGIRAGIEGAIQLKADSGSIVEAISAEDIGKLPDTSIAESISRLPGITSQRAEGRASAISLRGTDPGFTTALLNGREQVSTGDNRSVEFDQYPSELINQVVVYKTPDAQLVGQGLAGTIDLRTVRPLAYGKQAVVLNLRGEQNSNSNLGADSKDTGYRASFSYIDQFADGKVGFAFGYAHLDTPTATRGFGTYEPWKTSGSYSVPPTWDVGVPADAYITEGFKVRTDMGSTKRDGFMAALQFKPNDFYSGTIDAYYSTMDQTDNARSIEVKTKPGDQASSWTGDTFPPGSIFNYSDVTIKGNSVVAGTLNNVVPMARNFLFTTKDEILATGWLNEFTVNDEWRLLADVSYSKATRDQVQYETNAAIPGLDGNRFTYDTGTFNIRQGHMPSLSFNLDYADPTLVLLGNTPYGSGWSKKPNVTDDLTSLRLDAERTADLWWFQNTSFGINYSDRTKDKVGREGGINTIGNNWVQVTNPLSPTNLGYANAGHALAWDVKAALRDYYQPIQYLDPATTPWLIPKNWKVEEKVWTGFLRGDLNHEISSSVTLKGNIGLQVINTDQSSTARKVENPYTPEQQILQYTDGTSYTDVLPQINLAFMLPDDQAVRLGVAQELARARMDQLKASADAGYTRDGTPSGSGGNPRLDPWRAWAFDASYEKYFADHKGYVSAALFYKDLSSYIYSQTDGQHDFSDLLAATPPSYFNDGVTPSTTGNFTRPINGKGGYLWGMEFTASVPFDLFADALDGFGAIVSYSYTDSSIKVQGSINNVESTNIPLPGLSQDVWNATLYYEKYGFGARIATRYRSEYIGEVTNFANDRALRYVDSDMITDAQLSYQFGGGMLDGLQVLFQVNNLTNAPYVAYVQDKSRVLDYQDYGTQYLLGVNYRF
jgi:iron complex outermembrane receptor protein